MHKCKCTPWAFVPWVASTGNRRIWKNRSTQNWLKSSATEPQIVSKPHRKDVAPGAGLSYPALARRHSSVGEDKASCMTRTFLSRPGCWQGKHTLTIFSDSSRVHAGPPGVGFELLEHEPFLPFYTTEIEAKPGVELLMWNLSNAAKESSLLGHVIQQSLPKSFPCQRWDSNPRPRRDWSLNPAP